MHGLYKKVLKGQYPKIPNHFSADLANVIKPMLQVSAHLRPSCGNSGLVKLCFRKNITNVISDKACLGSIRRWLYVRLRKQHITENYQNT